MDFGAILIVFIIIIIIITIIIIIIITITIMIMIIMMGQGESVFCNFAERAPMPKGIENPEKEELRY